MKRIETVTSVLFLTILFGFSVLFCLAPDRSFSEQENRSLQKAPVVSVKNLFSGQLSREVNRYFSDQFPLRDLWVGIKGCLELASGKGENNGILLGDHGQLARRKFAVLRADGTVVADCDAYDPTHLEKACQGINRAAEGLDVPFSVLLTGRNIDIAASALDYPSDFSDALLSEMENRLSPSVQAISTVKLLREKFDNGEAVYYKTDHHWTTSGAYYGYVETMKAFGMTDQVIPMDQFEKRTASTSFYGTLWSAGGMKWVEPDEVQFWIAGNEDSFRIVADGKEHDGFYNEEWLARKDHYSAFLDGTHDVVTVRRRDGAERPTLLILKDSFANSIAPFLAQHFDLVLLNLSSTRQDFTNVSELAREYGADRVMLIYTLENVITADKLCRLK
ncbi:MAG: hypothetical protein IKC59_03970 [Clostridia bacterium]|nr:hypothetical protein [Clostridia bacterium]